MYRSMNFYYIICFMITLFFFNLSLESGRSRFRKVNARQPIVTMKSKKSPKKKYTRSDWYYHKEPLFTVFDETFFFNHLLPETGITIQSFQENALNVTFQELSMMLEQLVQEVKEKRNEYTYFTLLTNKNFNRKKKCGLLIVKFKKYPLVAKLFIEYPETLINPQSKDFENVVFHLMGKGCNRHYAGFTRIINLENLKKRIEKSGWDITLPRKWFWIPQDPEWIEITGKNIEKDIVLTTTIPGIYVIIADELQENPQYAIDSYTERHHIVMQFCNEMNLTIDPHMNNFILEKRSGKLSIGLVDTEHFPTLVGMQENITFQNHTQWYFSLSHKAIKDFFFTSKADHMDSLEKITI